MTQHKILWGVCGIGHGHTFRQLPLIEDFASNATIVIFGYDNSYDFFKDHFKDNPNVHVIEIAVPFYVGGPDGLDFEATAKHPKNQRDFDTVNARAMAGAQKLIGKPDLAISDYDPVSAGYVYAYGAPLVTIDQQSKYLCGDFPPVLNGQTCKDEIMRLRMFFPVARQRIATTFFRVAQKPDADMRVTLSPPLINARVKNLRRNPDPDDMHILLYLSSQRPFGQSYDDIIEICATTPNVTFHVFGANSADKPADVHNVHIYRHGDPMFCNIMERCNGIVSTAGHSLLSEAMHHMIPVYAMPLPLYEQEMNAHIIGKNGFGIAHPRLSSDKLAEFIRAIPDYTDKIKKDPDVLMRDKGHNLIIHELRHYLA